MLGLRRPLLQPPPGLPPPVGHTGDVRRGHDRGSLLDPLVRQQPVPLAGRVRPSGAADAGRVRRAFEAGTRRGLGARRGRGRRHRLPAGRRAGRSVCRSRPDRAPAPADRRRVLVPRPPLRRRCAGDRSPRRARLRHSSSRLAGSRTIRRDRAARRPHRAAGRSPGATRGGVDRRRCSRRDPPLAPRRARRQGAGGQRDGAARRVRRCAASATTSGRGSGRQRLRGHVHGRLLRPAGRRSPNRSTPWPTPGSRGPRSARLTDHELRARWRRSCTTG